MGNEQQARKDAMADAETLRRILPSVIENHPLLSETYLLRPVRTAAGRRLTKSYGVKDAVRRAVNTARAAFRAVPALRGDR